MLSASLLLVDLRSPINIGMCLRLAETFAIPVQIFDPSGVMNDASKRSTTSDFACGALERVGYRAVADLANLRESGGWRRVIASSITADATPLERFDFAPGDLIAVGNEYDGLPEDFVAQADAAVRISMADVWTPKPRAMSPIDPTRAAGVARDGLPNLNVAISAGILCHAAFVTMRPQAG